MSKFNQLAPAIDRTFRFIEMLGITALLSVIFAYKGDGVVVVISLCGTFLAILYWTEPAVDWVGGHIVGEQPTPKRAIAGMMFLIAAGFLAFLAAPCVGEVALLIGKTIK